MFFFVLPGGGEIDGGLWTVSGHGYGGHWGADLVGVGAGRAEICDFNGFGRAFLARCWIHCLVFKIKWSYGQESGSAAEGTNFTRFPPIHIFWRC